MALHHHSTAHRGAGAAVDKGLGLGQRRRREGAGDDAHATNGGGRTGDGEGAPHGQRGRIQGTRHLFGDAPRLTELQGHLRKELLDGGPDGRQQLFATCVDEALLDFADDLGPGLIDASQGQHFLARQLAQTPGDEDVGAQGVGELRQTAGPLAAAHGLAVTLGGQHRPDLGHAHHAEARKLAKLHHEIVGEEPARSWLDALVELEVRHHHALSPGGTRGDGVGVKAGQRSRRDVGGVDSHRPQQHPYREGSSQTRADKHVQKRTAPVIAF